MKPGWISWGRPFGNGLLPSVALLVVIALGCALGAAGASAPDPGSTLWAKRYNGPANDFDQAKAMAISPDGSRVFVTGQSVGAGTKGDFLTIAYDATTGGKLWLRRYNGPGNRVDFANAIAVSPDSSAVYVTGNSSPRTQGYEYATVAYDARTGSNLWVRTHHGAARDWDDAADVAVSPGGSLVFVTGAAAHGGGQFDYVTIAYEAGTGKVRWMTSYNGPKNSHDYAEAISLSPSGSRIFVTGASTGRGDAYYDYATVAYRARTGEQLWVRRHDGLGSNADDEALFLAISPSGYRVYVTGFTTDASDTHDYLTIAYDTASGRKRWMSRYDGSANDWDEPSGVAVAPDGRRVFVTGYSMAVNGEFDAVTIAYRAATGARVWKQRYNNSLRNGDDGASAIVVSPDGSTVFVTGGSAGMGTRSNYVTIAYDAANGSQSWLALYNGPIDKDDGASAIAVGPAGARVFVTGTSGGPSGSGDFETIAYST